MTDYNKNLLTAQELEILKLTSQGLDNTEIGKKMFISKHTVKAHISKICKKLNAANRTNAAFIAGKNDLI